MESKINRFDQAAFQWDMEERRVKLANSVFEAMSKQLNLAQNLEIAEIGAGTGLLLLHFLPFAKTITAFDSSEGMLDVLKTKLHAIGIENVFPFFLDIEYENLNENSFDLVISSMTFHHIKNTESALRKIFQAIKPGGQVCIADLETEDGSFHSDASEGIFHLGFDMQNFAELMKKCGFLNVQIKNAFDISKNQKLYEIFVAFGQKPE